MLRRTFATLSLRAGMNLLHLQELLGHSTLEMTKRYIQMVEDDLKPAHERFGPVDHVLVDAIGLLLVNGNHLVTVQKLMGHASPTMAAYDRRRDEVKRRVSRSLHVPYVRGEHQA